MTKKKKRNKQYQGADATTTRPRVTRYQAVQRSRTGEWWHEKKRPIKIGSIVVGIIFILGLSITELFKIVF